MVQIVLTIAYVIYILLVKVNLHFFHIYDPHILNRVHLIHLQNTERSSFDPINQVHGQITYAIYAYKIMPYYL